VGDEVEALVLTKEDKEGRLILSKKRAQYERAWGTIEELKEKDEAVKGTVIEVVKGGLILDIGLRGFLPASLVEMRRVRDLQPYIGKEIEAKIIELDKNRNNVVLVATRLAGADPVRGAQRSSSTSCRRAPSVRVSSPPSSTSARSSTSAGVSTVWCTSPSCPGSTSTTPSEVVTVGDEVTVEVLDVDMDRERVSLSAQGDPGRPVAALRPHPRHRPDSCRARSTKLGGRSVRSSASKRASKASCTSPELAERHVEVPDQVVAVG